MGDWLSTALEARVVGPALRVAAVVGTILVAINQGDALLAGALPASALWKIPLTYCVPYCVSTWSAVQAIRSR